MFILKRLALLSVFGVVIVGANGAHAESCGSLMNAYGPFDYRTASTELRERVEKFHFTESVATLRAGASSVAIGGDISYTLRVFPNHPRALSAMAELARRQKTDRPRGSIYSVDCWFDRAVRYQPNDATVRVVYGIAMMKNHKYEEAIRQLEAADKLAPDDPDVHYNLGLAYYNMRDYEHARQHAKKAYEMGYPLPGLKNMLERVNQWQ